MRHRNKEMHAVIKTMMAPFYDNKIEWHLGTLCRAAGIPDMRVLPRCNNNCFRWMLGSCEGKEGEPGRCKQRPENLHPKAGDIPDDYAVQLVELLQPGVDKLLSNNQGSAKRQRY